MGRGPRIDGSGAWHHVMNRGAGRRMVFGDDRERQRFLELLGVIDVRYGVETHAFCLMGNHYHLLVRSSRGRLSHGMRYLTSEYTRRVNHWRDVDGPIFRGRFTSVLVEEPAHLQWLCRYIHRNPVEAGLAATARDYRWSSLGAIVGDCPAPHWLHTGEILGWFGRRPDRILDFVDAPPTEADDEWPVPEAPLGTPSGDVRPGALTVGSISQPDRIRLTRSAVAAAFRVDPAMVYPARRGAKNAARSAFVLLAVDVMEVRPAAVAAELGVADGTARNALHRARRRTSDPQFARAVGDAVQRLITLTGIDHLGLEGGGKGATQRCNGV